MAEATAEATPPTHKAKSNAKLTYELLSEVDLKLTLAMERGATATRLLNDHEARLRALETVTTAFMAGTTQQKTDRTALWAALGTIVALAIQTIAVIEAIIRFHT